MSLLNYKAPSDHLCGYDFRYEELLNLSSNYLSDTTFVLRGQSEKSSTLISEQLYK
jgi:hypothetical protein